MKSFSITLLLAAACTAVLAQDQQGPAVQPPTRTLPSGVERGRGGPGGTFGGFVGPSGTTTSSSAQIEPGARGSSSGSTLSRLAPSTSRPLPETIGKALRFEVLIAELYEQADAPSVAQILELEKAGKLSFANRMQLATVESEPTFVQLGALTPRISGRTATSRDVIPIYTDINVGTIAQITGRVEDDGSIVAQIYVERSAISGGPEGAFDPGLNTPPKGVDRILSSSTVRLKPGEPQLVGGSQATQGSATSKSWIIVTGHVGAGSAGTKGPAGNAK